MQSFLTDVVNFVKRHGLDGVEFAFDHLGRGKSVKPDVELLRKITKSLCNKLQGFGYICMITLIGNIYGEDAKDTNLLKDVSTIIR